MQTNCDRVFSLFHFKNVSTPIHFASFPAFLFIYFIHKMNHEQVHSSNVIYIFFYLDHDKGIQIQNINAIRINLKYCCCRLDFFYCQKNEKKKYKNI